MDNYSNLRKLIFNGFLTQKAKINNLEIVFKTISEAEYNYIESFIVNPKNQEAIKKFNIYFVLYSIFSIESEIVLPHQHEFVKEFYPILKKLPYIVIAEIISKLGELNSKVAEASGVFESYLYGNESKSNWKLFKNSGRSFEKMNYIKGIDSFPLNYLQQEWINFNESEDEHTTFDSYYNLAKFVASAINPKGIKKISNQDETNKKLEEERREYILKKGAKVETERWVDPAFTKEDLVDQLMSSVSGDYDKHDAFMKNYDSHRIEEIRKIYGENKEKRKQKVQEIEKQYQEKLDNLDKLGVNTTQEFIDLQKERQQALKNLPRTNEEDNEFFQYLKTCKGLWTDSINKELINRKEASKNLKQVFDDEYEEYEEAPEYFEKRMDKKPLEDLITPEEIQKNMDTEGSIGEKLINKSLAGRDVYADKN